ncbi:MAG: response regulator transcription factor [Bacteroidota bacterium]
MDKIYIALAEDHELMRNGLSLILESIENVVLLHSATNGKELINFFEENKTLPDIILLDIDMPELDGFETCKEIKEKYKDVGVIFLTSHISKKFIENAILVGGQGYLSKSSDVDEIIEAIQEVYFNGYYYNEFVEISLIKQLLEKGSIKQYFSSDIDLTPREIDFIRFLCKEMTDAEIGNEMNISPLSAETYRKKLLKKVGVKKAIGLAIFAVKNDLL